MSPRKVYSPEEKLEALALVREQGVQKAARRLGIPWTTLHDWKAATKACAYSPYVGRGRTMSQEERERLLQQLIHEQELELRFIGRGTYRNDPKGKNPTDPKLGESLDVVLERAGVVQRHLLEWLDPTFEQVAERLEATPLPMDAPARSKARKRRERLDQLGGFGFQAGRP